jgi:hypothetical protein
MGMAPGKDFVKILKFILSFSEAEGRNPNAGELSSHFGLESPESAVGYLLDNFLPVAFEVADSYGMWEDDE